MVNIIPPNSPATFNERVAAMSATHGTEPMSNQPAMSAPTPLVPKKTMSKQTKTILAALGLLVFVGFASLAVLISIRQRQQGGPVAPNAPASKPQAFIEKLATCSLTFDIPVNCNSLCLQTSDCAAINPDWDCLEVSDTTTEPTPTVTSTASPTVTVTPAGTAPTITVTPATATPTVTLAPSVTTEPTVTVTPAGTEPSATPTQGVLGTTVVKRCRLVANPSSTACILAGTPTPTITPVPPTSTPGPTATPTPLPSPTPTGVIPTPTPTPTGVIPTPTPTRVVPTPTPVIVVTTINCNDNCSQNSDCTNASHICYGGKCRLDANPESDRCVMPSGQTTVIVEVTRAPVVELPRTGPADWANYLKVGFGALGIGALLLLFL